MNSFLSVALVFSQVPALDASPAYYAVRHPGNCTFPINLLLLQDATGSMQEAFPGTAQVTLPALNASVPVEHPGSTFSLAIFKDKGVISLGESGDICQEGLVLGAETPMAFEPFYSSYIPSGGWDWPENQFGAIVALLNSPESFPWTTADSAGIATNLIVMITDSAPHFEGDSAQNSYPSLAPWGSGYDEMDADGYCSERYYPSAETVRDALHNTNTYLGQIIISPEFLGGRALNAARWFNEFLQQDPAFVLGNYEDTTNWLAEITSILDSLKQHECDLISTTTSPSSTAMATSELESTTSSSSTSLLTQAPPATTAETEEATDTTLETAITDETDVETEAETTFDGTTEPVVTIEPSILPVFSVDTTESPEASHPVDTIATLVTEDTVLPTMPLVSTV